MGKVKKEKQDKSVAEESMMDVSVVKDEDNYDDKLKHVSIIAKPMAPRKLSKKCYKLIKKAVKHKTFLRNGLKDVQTRMRKGETGYVVLESSFI